MNIKELPTDIVECLCLEWTLQAKTSLANTNSTDGKAKGRKGKVEHEYFGRGLSWGQA